MDENVVIVKKSLGRKFVEGVVIGAGFTLGTILITSLTADLNRGSEAKRSRKK